MFARTINPPSTTVQYFLSFPLPLGRDFVLEWPVWQNGRPAGYDWFHLERNENPLSRTVYIWFGNVYFMWEPPPKPDACATL